MTNQPLRRIAPAALILPLLAVAPALAQVVDEDLKITASDAEANDLFGQSVAVSGTTAIVGAYGEDDRGNSSGAAYLFDTTTGTQIAKLKASDAASADQFGFSVAISGTTAIVGAWGDDDRGSLSGSAYLFDTTTGSQIAKLTASDGALGDQFGYSVAISGTTAIVGAYLDDDGAFSAGSAYLFDTATGQQIAKLTASDGALGDQFGYSVAISGTTAMVGAWFDDDAGNSSGSAYLFDFSDPNNIIESKLTASDGAVDDLFGSSVAISGTTAIVGARLDDDAGFNSGSAYLFDTTTGQQITKLTASDGASADQFGFSVAISGTTAIVGARLDDDAGSSSGTAYLFDTTTGLPLGKLTASDAASGDEFGYSVAISGTTAIVGARFDDDAGSASGSAYIFDNSAKVVQQPQSTIVDFGATALIRVELADTSGVQYQWRRDGVDLADGGNISGSSTAELQIVAGEDDLAFYDCVLTPTWGPATATDQAVLGVRPDPDACYPDANGDGVLDFFDISQFIIEFGRGCP